MEKDEAWTIRSVEENKKLIRELIEEYKGRVVDATGDNLLAGFNSVINAVECAVNIQKEPVWLTYVSMEDGPHVYVTLFPDVKNSGKWLISKDGGHSP